jgi:D-alanyl-D-alanine dipeptidase
MIALFATSRARAQETAKVQRRMESKTGNRIKLLKIMVKSRILLLKNEWW